MQLLRLPYPLLYSSTGEDGALSEKSNRNRGRVIYNITSHAEGCFLEEYKPLVKQVRASACCFPATAVRIGAV
jgi:hypothetical protein